MVKRIPWTYVRRQGLRSWVLKLFEILSLNISPKIGLRFLLSCLSNEGHKMHDSLIHCFILPLPSCQGQPWPWCWGVIQQKDGGLTSGLNAHLGQLSMPAHRAGHLAVALVTLSMQVFEKATVWGVGALYASWIQPTFVYLQQNKIVNHDWFPQQCFAWICEATQVYNVPNLFLPSLAAIRMVLLMMVAVALNAVFTVEQPFSSFFEFYPRWRDFVQMLQLHGGPHSVSWTNSFLCEETSKGNSGKKHTLIRVREFIAFVMS